MQNRKLTQSQIVERIELAWHIAEVCKWEHAELLDYLQRTLWDELSSRTPAGDRRYTCTQSAYASGYAHAMHNRCRMTLVRAAADRADSAAHARGYRAGAAAMGGA